MKKKLSGKQVELGGLAEQLRQKVAGKKFPHAHYHHADPYSSPPADLVRGFAHDPKTGVDDEKRRVWYFYWTVRRQKSAAAGKGAPKKPSRQESAGVLVKSPRRDRAIKGGDDRMFWRAERGRLEILDAEDSLVGLSFTLTSVKIDESGGREGQGWIMVEIMLPELVEADEQIVLFKLYRSPRAKKDKAPPADELLPLESKPEEPSIEEVKPPPVPLAGDVSPLESKPEEPPIEEVKPPPVPLAGDVSPLESKPEEPPIEEAKPDLLISNDSKFRSSSSTAEGFLSRSRWVITKSKPPAAGGPVVVMMLGASSVKSTEWIKVMANHVLNLPAGGAVVLSALGNTSTNLYVAALKAFRHGSLREIHEIEATKKLHLSTVAELGLDSSILSGLFDVLDHTLDTIPQKKQLNVKIRYDLALFAERMCSTIFAAYLNRLGEEAGEEWKSQPINICGRGGSDFTATTIAKDLGSTEIQVWEDVEGVMTCDPTVCANARPQPYLTFEEAAQIMTFGTKSMQLAKEGAITIKVKNLYRPEAPGTVITSTRDMSKDILTSIVLNSNIIMLDIGSKRLPAQAKFVAKCKTIFENEGIVYDYFASREDRISVIVDSSKQSSRELVQMELGTVVKKLREFADVNLQDRSIISLVGNAQEYPNILGKAFSALRTIDVKVQLLGQLSAKEDEQVTAVSFVVKDSEAKHCVQALHSEFFELNPANSSPASSPGEKRKVNEDHPEAPPSVRQLQMNGTDPIAVQERTDGSAFGETECTEFSEKPGDPAKYFHSIHDNEPVRSDIEDLEMDLGNLDCLMNVDAPEAQPEQFTGHPIDWTFAGLSTAVPVDYSLAALSTGLPTDSSLSGVPREVGGSSNGAHNVLDRAEANNDVLNNNYDQFWMSASNDRQRLSGGNDFGYLPPTAGYPIGAGNHPYPPPPGQYPIGAGNHPYPLPPGQYPIGAGNHPYPPPPEQYPIGAGNHPYPPPPGQYPIGAGYQTSAGGDSGSWIGGGNGGGYSAGLAARAPDGHDPPLFNEDERRYLDRREDYKLVQGWFAPSPPLH